MKRRHAVVTAVLVLSAGCGSGGSPVTARSPSVSLSPTLVTTTPSPSPPPLSAADVRRAAAEVPSNRTATYEYSLKIAAGYDRMSSTHVGSVDFATRRHSSTTRFDASPRLAQALTRSGPSPDQLTTKIFVDRDVMYLQMAAWPPPHQGRWLRFTKAEMERATGFEYDADAFATVPLLDVLSRVTTGVPRPAREIDLTLPVADVLASAPTKLVRSLAEMGVDLERLRGSVVATAWLEQGLPVVQIELAGEVKRLVAATGRESGFANAITSLVVRMTVLSVGVPFGETPPPAHLVMSPEEMDGASG